MVRIVGSSTWRSTKIFSVTTYKPFGIAFGASGTEKFTYAREMQEADFQCMNSLR